MNTVTGYLGGLFAAVCELVVGVLLFIDPTGFTASIITVFGALLTIMGLIQVLKYFRKSPEDGAEDRSMTMGLLKILGGLFCALRSDWLISAFPVLTILYGVGSLVLGAYKVQTTVDLLRLKRNWVGSGISTAVTLLCGAILLLHPPGSAKARWILLAACLVAGAVLDIGAICFFGKTSDGKEAAE